MYRRIKEKQKEDVLTARPCSNDDVRAIKACRTFGMIVDVPVSRGQVILM